MSDRSSLSSSSSVEEETHSFENAPPIQLEADTTTDQQRRRGSLLRRLSTGLSIPSSLDSDQTRTYRVRRQPTNYSFAGISTGVEAEGEAGLHDYYFGTDAIQKSVTRKTTSDAEKLEEFPQKFEGQYASDPGADNTELSSQLPATPIARRRSTVVQKIQSISQRFGFWDKEFHNDRVKMIMAFLSNYIYLVIGFILPLCIYWGSYYERASRYKDLKFLVVLAEEEVAGIPPIISGVVEYFFTNVTAIQALGDFRVMNFTQITTLSQSHNLTIQEEVYRQIHHQKYWTAFYVKENATFNYYSALKSANTTFNPSVSLMQAIYETGSNFNAVNNYIVSIVNNIIQGYLTYLPKTALLGDLLQALDEDEIASVASTAPNLLTSLVTFEIIDLIPVTNQIFTGILSIALIYIVLFTFFQYLFSVSIHTYIATKISGGGYIAFRMLVSQISYLFLALAFVVLNTAFQISPSKTFGKSGFLVIWAWIYLLMSSLGSFIEALGLIMVIYKPQLIGFVLLFVAVINVAPVVSPIVLCPPFYRYGYAMPVHAAYDLMHVAYFNSWKGRVGLDIGIMIAWMIISNIALPFVMRWMGEKIAKRKEEAAAAAAAAAATEDTAEDLTKIETNTETSVRSTTERVETNSKLDNDSVLASYNPDNRE
ncbi:nitrosoguanidine resistance protein Sng1p [[Candida] railenensis]|uniref:Nitrosoguanidine resistance protein Sng1p n=1 Tax=[Candida] railenensis TaxID=45579 RepID=A0A9P0QW44_9ASCO|nr:nitrosoguanidine resistance protein Sng1p [[Candida] railenensis]